MVAYILTLNAAATVERAIRSLQDVADDVLVVDSESTDATCSVARGLGARVIVHPFEGFSFQRNWSLAYIREHYGPEYVLAVDADEWLDAELAADLRSRMAESELVDDVYLLHLRVHFDGRPLRWGGFANTWLPRLFKLGVASYEARQVNEHLSLVPSASIGRLRGHIVNGDVASWHEYIAKHNRYSTLEASARVELNAGIGAKIPLREALRRPYLRRRWLRQHIWDRLPARPALRFVQIYVLAGGMLDGRAGFHRALFEAWQEMCTDLKAEEQTLASGR